MPDEPYEHNRRTVKDQRPIVTTVKGAEQWIGILHHRTVQDAQRMNRIEERLRRLERPWWRFWRT